MTDEVQNQSVREFLESLASRSPTPGGGCAAALAGAMAAALLSMFCRLTLGKKKYQDVEAEMVSADLLASGAQRELLRLAQKDVEVFERVMAVRGDAAEYQMALKLAAEVPHQVAEHCLLVFLTASQVIWKGNQNARSDAHVAIALAKAAALGALANVTINLGDIENSSFRERMDAQVQDILSQINWSG